MLKAKSQTAEESSQSVATTKRRTDDQGMREKGTKHRTLAASPKESGAGDKQKKFENIADMFDKKSIEEVSSSVPSSAGMTPPSIPIIFQSSVSALPTEQQAIEQSGVPAHQSVLLSSDPRSAQLASDIRSKFEKKSKSTPPPKSGDGTARSTPSSSFGELD